MRIAQQLLSEHCRRHPNTWPPHIHEELHQELVFELFKAAKAFHPEQDSHGASGLGSYLLYVGRLRVERRIARTLKRAGWDTKGFSYDALEADTDSSRSHTSDTLIEFADERIRPETRRRFLAERVADPDTDPAEQCLRVDMQRLLANADRRATRHHTETREVGDPYAA